MKSPVVMFLFMFCDSYHQYLYVIGNSRWVHAMEWSGQNKFVASPEVPFVVDDSEAGVLKNYGPLSFLKVSLLSLHRAHLLILISSAFYISITDE